MDCVSDATFEKLVPMNMIAVNTLILINENMDEVSYLLEYKSH